MVAGGEASGQDIDIIYHANPPLKNCGLVPASNPARRNAKSRKTVTCLYTLQPSAFGNLISQRRDAASSFYHLDALGSVCELTDISESVTNTYLYQAYGHLVASTGSTPNPFLWVGNVGYYFDADRLEYYIRQRHYDPAIARWLSKDPSANDPVQADVNLYRYVHNNPLIYVDPSGLKDVTTNVKTCKGDIKGDWLWGNVSSHDFIAVGGTGYGRYSKDGSCFGNSVIKSDDLNVYPEKDPSSVAKGQPYSICTPIVLNDEYYDTAKFVTLQPSEVDLG